MTLGEKLKYLRELRKLTQAEVAKQTEISRSRISELESDNGDPLLSNLTKLANLYRVKKSFLLDEDAFTLENIADIGNYQLPDELKEFVMNQKELPFIVMAKKISEEGVSIGFIEKMVTLYQTEFHNKK